MVVVVVRVFDSKQLAPCYTVVDAILEIRRWTRVSLHVDGCADSGRGRNGGIHWAEADFVSKDSVARAKEYCLDGPVIFTEDVIWFCEDCEPKPIVSYSLDQSMLLASKKTSSSKVKL
ncbi:serine/threonine-protein phosphatase BSL3 [Trifolium repens]|nr:serine/threonine-protein phosphatase BSL3 [Trifolium repens]